MAEAGRVPPSAIQPDLSLWGSQIIDAFLMLNGSRPYVEGTPMPIPLTEIYAYLQIIDVLDIDTRLDYIRFLQVCDTAYRESTKSKEVTPNGGNTGRQRQSGRSSSRRSRR
jgi:hypothetical protein